MGGGASVLAADECENAGLAVPVFPPEVRQELLKFTPPVGVGLRNPIDSSTGVYMDAALVARTVKVVADWDGIDLLFVVLPAILAVKIGGQLLRNHIGVIAEAAKNINKPIVIILRTGGFGESERVAREVQGDCIKAGFPAFLSIDSAARAVVCLISYHESRNL